MKTVGKIVLAGVILLVLVVGGCIAVLGGVANEVDKEIKKDASTVTTIKYEVETDTPNRVDVTFSSDGEGGISQANGQVLNKEPWTKTIKDKGDPLFRSYSITAQHGMVAGEITCRIFANGELVKENTSTGRSAVVTCNYTEE